MTGTSRSRTRNRSSRNVERTTISDIHIKVVENRVYLPCVGWVKFYKGREITGKIKSATIKREASGWYISIHVEIEKAIPKPAVPMRETSVGIDLGLRRFVTLSTGEMIENPRYYREAERRLRKAQKSLSRKVKGSNNWYKAKQRVARCHEDVARCRKDFLDQLSTKLVNNYDLICIETLNVEAIKKSLRLGKSVSDAGWGKFIWMLEYKAVEKGKRIYKADRWRPSSKTCNSCGFVHKGLKLSDEVFECPNCGLVIDRDLNAAINLVAVGLTETLTACGGDVRLATPSGDRKQTSVKQEPNILVA